MSQRALEWKDPEERNANTSIAGRMQRRAGMHSCTDTGTTPKAPGRKMRGPESGREAKPRVFVHTVSVLTPAGLWV
jgi:hypothetical protein